MNKMGSNKRKYTVVKNPDIEIINEDNTSVWKYIFQFGLLALLCILAFLVAKYIVRSDIDGEKVPIDTSERL